ncbi:MAG TPA: glutathione S-transferase C-terminal domain-containing protein [Aliidongia sp.]|uniref:glutathione S-transferase family protein n=1 Tax=Aliidongia sp. TaxID=1914230 RepID=UPI002DDD2763|nr:glutathione S-transferase C-terminal domain-containing protein [Aliidongia sp.]HEV2677402.1 glutathione S-transferase C-terminal domain-containing protein [Aliidongia sp.]
MKLFYGPGTCALGIHVILEEIGKPYDLQKIDFATKEQYSDAFKAINPKSKVPTLERDDGSILTEFPAIATWLARTNPEAKLLPDDVDGQVRALEAIDYVVATLHMQGFSRLFRPENFGADQDAVKAKGRDIVANAFALMDKALEGKDFLLGTFSIADAALFYTEFWARERMKLDLPANCLRHYETMRARPAITKALAAEGFGA